MYFPFNALQFEKSFTCHLRQTRNIPILSPRARVLPDPPSLLALSRVPCSPLRTGAAPHWSKLPAHLLSDWSELCVVQPSSTFMLKIL